MYNTEHLMRRVNDDDITKLCTLLYYISTVMLENIFAYKKFTAFTIV